MITYTWFGKKLLLDWALRLTGEDTVLRLFVNDVTPNANSVAADLTEASFTGYSAKTLTRASWSPAVLDDSGTNPFARIDYSVAQEWTAASEQLVYGYYLTTVAGELIGAERWATPELLRVGDVYAVTPKLILLPSSANSGTGIANYTSNLPTLGVITITKEGAPVLLDWALRIAPGTLTFRILDSAYIVMTFPSTTLVRADWSAAARSGSAVTSQHPAISLLHGGSTATVTVVQLIDAAAKRILSSLVTQQDLNNGDTYRVSQEVRIL